MRRGTGGRDPFFDSGDPFGGFGGFGGFRGFGGPGGPRSLMSSFFGGRDPFDDPFFTQPFGGMFESSFFGPSGNVFADMHPSGFIEQPPPEARRSHGPIIEELNSDDDKEAADSQNKGNSRKHGRSSSEPYVEQPDDQVEERRSKQIQCMNHGGDVSRGQRQPQTHSYTFHSSSVTYGGANGAYYTSSKTRRMGSDGVNFEEFKEADTATREATHRVSRGLHNKGHSVTRKLNSDGRVDSNQTLHNLNEDELLDFEQSWARNDRNHLPDWPASFGSISGGGSDRSNGQPIRALPPTESRAAAGPSHTQTTRPTGTTNLRGRSSNSRGNARN